MQQLLLVSLILAPTLSFFSQQDSLLQAFRDKEALLQSLQKQTFHDRNEQERFKGNKEFLAVWEDVIRDPRALTYDFDLKKDVSILTAPDKSFRLITWNIPKEDGTHAFFGYVLAQREVTTKTGWFKRKTEKNYETYQLLDRSSSVRSPESHSGGPDKWFGMVYTALIPCSDYYTLLGWDGNNKLTTRKFVDVLWFKSDGTPVFGKDVFSIPRKNPRRMMFEYSSDVTMSLRYDEKNNQIVYNHLASHKEGQLLDGQYQFYGPDGRYDALRQKKDKWIIVEDVDARNDKSKKDETWNDPRKPSAKKHKKFLPGQR